MDLCSATTHDRYLGHLHRCGLPAAPAHQVHHCKELESFGACSFGWIGGFRTNALEDWLDWGWRIDSDYKGPPVETLERSTWEELLFKSLRK